MKIVKKGMVVCKHGVLKARCVEWFGRVVRGLNFGSTKTAGVLKGGFKVDKLFNQFRGVGEISIGVGGVSSVVASVMGASGASGVVSSSFAGMMVTAGLKR